MSFMNKIASKSSRKVGSPAVDAATTEKQAEITHQIRAYKMTHATGFAPNYNGGMLSLATCKAGIREKAKVGEWVAGFTSKTLNEDEVGKERLVYLMQVSEILTFEEYWDKYPEKRPDRNPLGDNIYLTEAQAEKCKCEKKETSHPKYVHARPLCKHTTDDEISTDLKSEKVLISRNFRYFGAKNPLEIPEDVNIDVPKGQLGYGQITKGERTDRFVDFVLRQPCKPDSVYDQPADSKASCVSCKPQPKRENKGGKQQ